jgi:hypothetical protein
MFSNYAGEVTKGLKLSDLELRSIRFVLEALAEHSNKYLADIDGITVTATHLKCLIRPVKEHAVKKWLCSPVSCIYTLTYVRTWHIVFDGN